MTNQQLQKGKLEKNEESFKKIPAFYDWIPFIAGFFLGLIWIFTMFYGMDYSSDFFSKGGGVNRAIPMAGWLKLFIPMFLIGIFVIIYTIVNRYKEHLRKHNYNKIKRNRKNSKVSNKFHV